MNKEIRFTTNEGKRANNEWENVSDFLSAWYIVYKN